MSLRDIFITAIVLGVVPFALRHPWIGIMLWTWISIMNPHRLAWGFAYSAPFAALAAGVTFIALFITKDKVKMTFEPIVIALLAFLAWVALTTMLAIDRPGSMAQLDKVFKIQLMTMVAIAVLHEPKHLRAFVWINVLSIGFYGVKGGLFTLRTGGVERVWGPPGGFIEGNNELALALVVVIPLMYYLRLTEPNKWVKRGLLAMMVLAAISALGTHSRGALLAIMAMGGVLWLRSPHKLALAVPLVVVALAMLAFMPENWVARMQTIQNYEEDGSAMGRIQAWQTMISVANSRVTGAGFSAYSTSIFNTYAPGEWPARAAHSIYFQVLGEHGWIGLILFLAIWVIAWRMASRIRKQARGAGGQAHALGVLAGMCQVSIVGYAVGGAFLSLAYFDLPYNILIMLLVATRVLNQVAQAEGTADVNRVVPDRGAGSRRPRRDSVFGPAQTTRTRASGSSASAAGRRA